MFKAIWDWMGTYEAIYVAGIVAIVAYAIHRTLKRKRTKAMMADVRLEGAVLTGPEIITPIAIAPDGHVGFSLGIFMPPIILHLKDVIAYELFFDGHSIERSEIVGKKGLAFKDTTSMIERRLKEKTKKIVLAFFTPDDHILNVQLFNTARTGRTAMRESARQEIIKLFARLEEAEKKAKKQ